MKSKQTLQVILSLVAMVGSGLWIWFHEVKGPGPQSALHRSVGTVLAEECLRTMSSRGRLLVIALEPGSSEVLDLQVEAFRGVIRQRGKGVEMTVVEVEAREDSRKGPGFGLSSSRLGRILRKNAESDLVVSFLGLPEVEETKETGGDKGKAREDVKATGKGKGKGKGHGKESGMAAEDVGGRRPKFVVLSRSLKKVGPLMVSGAVEVAVVPRFEFPSPVKGVPRSEREWFDMAFQAVRAETMGMPLRP